MSNGFSLQSSDRVFLAGKTGSGKTFAARHLLARVPRLVVFDSKGTLADWSLSEWGHTDERALIRGEAVRTRVTLPISSDPGDFWPGVAEVVLAAGDCTLYIDEVYAITPPGVRAPTILNAIWTRGREFRVGGWAATQRPAWVPLFIMSEADHYFVFRLTLDEDRKRVAGFMGEEVEKKITDKHGFYYMAATGDGPEYRASFTEGAKDNGT